jgi:pyruvate,water dikinase
MSELDLKMVVRSGDRTTIGSKAFDLHRCSLLEVEVPEFYVIPTKYFRSYNGIRIGNRLKNELKVIFAKLGSNVAVRSSSVLEDLASGSQAGKFKTILNVTTHPDLIGAVKSVWESANGSDMAVIIQKQLIPELSGVLFTRNPINGKNETVIEYIPGVCAPLVAGKMNPKKVKFDNPPGHNRSNNPFKKLLKISRTLEHKFGYPLDIEWAKSKKKFFILQARPITKLLPPSKDAGKTYSRVQGEEFFSGPVSPLFYSVFKDLYLNNYLQETIDSLQINLRLDDDILISYKNHLYVDTSFYEYALSHLPIRANKTRLLEIFPEDVRIDLESSKNRTDIPAILRIMKFILSHPRYWIMNLDRYFQNQVVPNIVANLEGITNFEDMTMHELNEAYTKLFNISIAHIRTSKWGLGLYSIPLIESMKRFLNRNGLRGDSLTQLLSGLEINKTLDASMELQRLAQLVRTDEFECEAKIFKLDLQRYNEYRAELEKSCNGQKLVDHFEFILKKFGHRRLSRDILLPAWADEPMIPFSILRNLICNGSIKVRKNQNISGNRREMLRNKILMDLPMRKRWRFRFLEKYLLRYLAFRELQRFYLDLILSKMRELILELSSRMVEDGLLITKNDIFFLDQDDVLD